MNYIVFSHRYTKMPNCRNFPSGFRNYVLAAQVVDDINSLPSAFLMYDTLFYGRDGKPENFPLLFRKGILIFIYSFGSSDGLGDLSYLWCTIRRWTSDKERYYRSLVGRQVDIIIKEDA